MARPLRIEFEGAWYHVMNRGGNHRSIFTTDEHRWYFLSLLADAAARFNAEWHAYCLMDNHYHLLLRTPEANLQRIMRHINGVYTQFYNRTEGQDGPLFRGRYQAILVEALAYWTHLSRYIHRNPLEAGVVKRLAHYRWSSYPAYIGKDTCPPWLTCQYILKSLAPSRTVDSYKAFVAEGIDREIKTFYSHNKQSPILGSDAFKQRLTLRTQDIDVPDLQHVRVKPSIERIVEVVCHRLRVDTESVWVSQRGRAVKNPARGMAMYVCQREADMKLQEIARMFGVKHYASAGSSMRQFEARLAQDTRLRKCLKLIKLDLTL